MYLVLAIQLEGELMCPPRRWGIDVGKGRATALDDPGALGQQVEISFPLVPTAAAGPLSAACMGVRHDRSLHSRLDWCAGA